MPQPVSTHSLPIHPLSSLPIRSSDSHKGMFGHGLLFGGTAGMLGAIVLAGQACLRTGAGLTTLAVPEAAQLGLGLALPCAMSLGLPTRDPADDRADNSAASGREIASSDWFKLLSQPKYHQAMLAIGPGLGRQLCTDQLVVQCWREWAAAAVFDADALNALASVQMARAECDRVEQGYMSLDLADHVAPRIMTPHPGEWERLSGVSRKDRAAQIDAARRLAHEWNVVVVLKGARTFVTNGRSEYLNTTGNPSMSVGGSGDCLTGIITALLCQCLSPLDAAILGTYLHGLAGDLAHAHLRSPSTLPTDLIAFLPNAFREIESLAGAEPA